MNDRTAQFAVYPHNARRTVRDTHREPIGVSLDQLVERAEALAGERGRRVLGLLGAPGSGKSTVATLMVQRMRAKVAIVEMDAFHLSDELLVQLGRRNRKGAPDTFDVDGYVEILRRLRESDAGDIYVPIFDRTLDTSVGSAQLVTADCELIITTGNYLLLDQEPWPRLRPYLDQSWFLEPDEELRIARLIARHVQYGKSPEEAREWVMRSDQRNARMVRGSRDDADLVVRLVS